MYSAQHNVDFERPLTPISHRYGPNSYAPASQRNWRHCTKCQTLYFAGNAVCAAGGVHDHSQRKNYALDPKKDVNKAVSRRWNRCFKCQVVFLNGEEGVGGACPVAGIHEAAHGMCFLSPTSGGGESEGSHGSVEKWRYCKDCKGLGLAEGVCSTGGKHTLDESEFYILTPFPKTATEVDEMVWKHCSKCQLIAFDSWNSCSEGGAHVSVGSNCYTMIYAADRHGSPAGEHGWDICSQCYCLVHDSKEAPGNEKSCSGVRKHALYHDRDYIVKIEKSQPELLEDGWAKCAYCSVMHRSTGTVGNCSQRPGQKHSSGGSKTYWLLSANSDEELVNWGGAWSERTAKDGPPGVDGW